MNKRNTIQRALALGAVKELHCHATAEEVYHAILAKHPNISRGTVYRNLNLLADIGEIGKIEMSNGADRYDHLCHRHYHARCIKCDRIYDMEMEYIVDLEKNIKDTHGFKLTGHDVMFKGICLECNA